MSCVVWIRVGRLPEPRARRREFLQSALVRMPSMGWGAKSCGVCIGVVPGTGIMFIMNAKLEALSARARAQMHNLCELNVLAYVHMYYI